MKKLFILVPSINQSGPVKGALALAHELIKTQEVTLVSLKSGFTATVPTDSRLKLVSLQNYKSIWARVKAYRRLLLDAGGRQHVVSLSYCFSADLTNLLCKKCAIVVASIRGNLPENYKMDHGVIGIIAAQLHMIALRAFDRVAVMTDAMARQIKPYLGRSARVIGNFIDEPAIEAFRFPGARMGVYRFVFLASLSKRKQPFSLLRAIAALKAQGQDVVLDVLGKGPLLDACRDEANRLGIQDCVIFHGHRADPYAILAAADCLVLPSLSEGMARAALEALYLGVPVVLRDVDGNASLVQNGANGYLFTSDDQLPEVMIQAALLSRQTQGARASLLPAANRQAYATHLYRELLLS